MRWPGHVAEGATDDRLTANIDVEPTLLEVAGITPTHTIDGVSMFDPGARQRLLLEYFKSPDSPLGPWASTITQTYQYTEWYNTTTGALTFREYYDLVNDPWQLVNLLADGNPSNDPPIAPLSAQLAADRACVGSACPRPVSTSPDTTPPSAPGTPTGTSTRAGQIDLSWAAASDDRATSLSYRVFRDGDSSPVGTVQGPATGTVTFTDSVGLQPGSEHTYAVDAFDGTNRGPLSAISAAITVTSGPPVIFADDFTAGFANWSGVTNLTIDNATGGVAPPSARSQLTSVPDYAFKNLTGGPFSSVCMSRGSTSLDRELLGHRAPSADRRQRQRHPRVREPGRGPVREVGRERHPEVVGCGDRFRLAYDRALWHGRREFHVGPLPRRRRHRERLGSEHRFHGRRPRGDRRHLGKDVERALRRRRRGSNSGLMGGGTTG